MHRYILIFVAAGLLSGLVWAESTGNNWLSLGFKTPLSILFVITALVQPRVLPKYFKFVLIGLILGLVGDVCLGLPGLTAFRIELVAFLGGAYTLYSGIRDPYPPQGLGQPCKHPDHRYQCMHLLVASAAPG